LNLKNDFEKIATGYNTSAGFYRPKLFVNPSRANTHKVAIPRYPDNRANRVLWKTIGQILSQKAVYEKVLPLATILVQVIIDQSYSLTLQVRIRTKSPFPDNREYFHNTSRHLVANYRTERILRKIQFVPLRKDGVAISFPWYYDSAKFGGPS
jgi:hypothetical protein